MVNFCGAAGGIATPADAALMMQLGRDGVFVGSGIFKSGDPLKEQSYCNGATNFNDLLKVMEASKGNMNLCKLNFKQ